MSGASNMTSEYVKQNKSKINKIPKSKVEKPAKRRIKPETLDCKLEKHFVVTIRQPQLYTKVQLFDLLKDDVEAICVTETDGIVTAYLNYSTPRSLACVSTTFNDHFKHADVKIDIAVTYYSEELLRKMTETDLCPLFKGIEAHQFHFNRQAVLWANMTPTFSWLDPFVMRHNERYPYLFALFCYMKQFQ